jgi:sulfide:quinone oxidoreductase
MKGKLAATDITERMTSGSGVSTYPASMADTGAGCVRTGNGLWNGSGASKAMHLVDPDPVRHPGTGRSLKDPFGEIGLGGRWIKRLLHYLFIYKANACPGWWLIPE